MKGCKISPKIYYDELIKNKKFTPWKEGGKDNPWEPDHIVEANKKECR